MPLRVCLHTRMSDLMIDPDPPLFFQIQVTASRYRCLCGCLAGSDFWALDREPEGTLHFLSFISLFGLYLNFTSSLLSLVFTIRLRQVLVPNGSAIFKGAKSLLLVSPFCFKTQPVLELQDPNEGFYPSKRNSGIIIPGRYKGGIRAQVLQSEYNRLVWF